MTQDQVRVRSGSSAGDCRPTRLADAALFLASSLLFIALALRIDAARGTGRFDLVATVAILQYASPALTALMHVGSLLADATVLLIPLMVLWLWSRSRGRAALLTLGSGLGAYGLTLCLKLIVHRAPPGRHLLPESMPAPSTSPLDTVLQLDNRYSFPSGHAVAVVVAYGLLVYFASRYLRGYLLAFVALAVAGIVALVAVSRIYLLRHYPTDVAGGLLLGLSWLLLSLRALRAEAGRADHPS
jgi:membrane-associated phospholipid phosphatase